jgi:hypothetical protein
MQLPNYIKPTVVYFFHFILLGEKSENNIMSIHVCLRFEITLNHP